MSVHVQLQHEFYDRLIESQYAPPEQRLQETRRQLAKLIHHARAQVPFYADRLDAIIRQNGEIDWERWNEIPLLTRDDLLSRRESMLARSLPGIHRGPVHALSTSGSTGAPISVSSSVFANDVLRAVLSRAHSWHQLDWARDMVVWLGDDPEVGKAPHGTIGPPWGPPWRPQSVGRSIAINRYASPLEVLTLMLDKDVRYLSARAKGAQYLANEAIRLGMNLKLDAILTFGTGIFPDEREDCLRAFGARMFGPYSSKEGQLMAYQCPSGPHFHVNEETTLLEVIDDQGRPCAPGQVGKVVVTSIYNFAQPIIRYDHGDLAVLGAPCACGRTLAVLERIAGRTTHLFRFPGERLVAPTLPFNLMRELLSAKYWQLAQIGPLDLEMRYVPTGNGPVDELETVRIIRARVHPDVAVVLKPIPELPRAFGGKYVEYVCELDKVSG